MILMFDKRFAEQIRDGSKRSTIRPKQKSVDKNGRKRKVITVGDEVDAMQWSGAAYRTPMDHIRRLKITEVIELSINEDLQIRMGTTLLELDERWQLSTQEGFASPAEMLSYIKQTYGVPFEGVLLEWK
jgi:hypothetical protein